jgi:hypothetical protein
MPSEHVEKAFEMWWPELKAKLSSLPEDEGRTQPSTRKPEEMLAELIDLARTTSKEIEELNMLVASEFDKSADIQAQIEYLNNVVAPGSSLSPTIAAAVASGMLNERKRFTATEARAFDNFFGIAQGTESGKASSSLRQAARKAQPDSPTNSDPESGPEKK